MTSDAVFLFAKYCANIYCKKFKSRRQVDDVTQQACLLLFENRDKWGLSDSKLRSRIIWDLIRWYQNEHGLRLKKRPTRVDCFPLESCRSTYRETKRIDDRDMIEVAIERAGLAKYRGVVLDLLDGYKRYEIAKRRGISPARVTELLEKFESEMQTLIRACC